MSTGGNQPNADVSMRKDSPRGSSPGLPLQRERRGSDRGNPPVAGEHNCHGLSGVSQLERSVLVRSPGSPLRHEGGGRRVRVRFSGGEQPRESVAACELENGGGHRELVRASARADGRRVVPREPRPEERSSRAQGGVPESDLGGLEMGMEMEEDPASAPVAHRGDGEDLEGAVTPAWFEDGKFQEALESLKGAPSKRGVRAHQQARACGQVINKSNEDDELCDIAVHRL